MAKIDTAQIEGYADMTAEQKLAALEAFELPEADYTGYVKKDVLDKATSDASAWKKKYRDTLDASEREAAERKDHDAAVEKELSDLRRSNKVTSYTANLVAQGYSEELARETAEAMADGNMEKVFANNQAFLTEYAKSVQAKNMRETKRPEVGAEGHTGDQDYRKLYKEALDKGDFTQAAYYQRLMFESQNKKK